MMSGAVGSPFPAAVAARSTSVLLVDDQAMIGEAVSRMLDAHGDIAFTFEPDPANALARAADVAPTVILLDLVMPEIDGLTLLKFFRANEPTADVPIIVLSSKEEAETKAEAFALGAHDYLVKLPDALELVARIRHHSNGYIAQIERNEAFAALAASEHRLAQELGEAATYVRSLLPQPMAGVISADWRFLPSVQLGGDSLGYHWLDQRHLAIFVLDVSGHGVKSALLSVTAMNALRTQALLDTDFFEPATVLTALNEAFQMEEYNDLYFTIWYGVFDTATRRLKYANAGHPPALLVAPGQDPAVARLGDPGFTIGMLPGVPFEGNEAAIPSGANLVIFSDGLYEVTQPDGELWSYDELARRVGAHDPGRGLVPLDWFVDTITSVRGSQEFEDDVTVLELRFD